MPGNYDSHLIDACLRVPLEQRRSYILNLRSLWPSPLAPQDIFDSLISKAAEVAQTLSTCQSHCDSFDYPLYPEQTVESIDNEDDLGEDGFDIEKSTDDILFDDYLLQTADSETFKPDVMSPSIDITLIWQLPVCHEALFTLSMY